MNFFQALSAQFDSSTVRDLYEWRVRVLNGILRGIFVIWMFALVSGVNNVVATYNREAEFYENPLAIAVFVVSIYLGATAVLVFITFDNRTLKFEQRAGLLLFLFYILGVLGMALSSFSGDGRLFLFTFIILSAVFFDLRYSLPAFIFTFLTLVVIGGLQISEILVVPAERQINATDSGAWISGGIVFLVLGIAALISISYLLQTLNAGLSDSRASLNREQRLSRTLRTISDINQLIVREQDQEKLLSGSCEKLISGRGYSFAWIGLLQADGVTLKLAASAGDAVDSEPFTISINEEEAKFSCATIAIRSRKYLRVDTSADGDPCLLCPRREKHPARSAISLPLLWDERIFGVLVVDHSLDAEMFDDEEITLLQELADDLAYALGNLESDKRLQTYARHQALLNEITQIALETSDFDTMLQRFIDGLEKVMNADGYYIALWDSASQLPAQFFSSASLREIFSSNITLEAGDRIFSKSILESGRALVVNDIMDTPYISPRVAALFPARSALGLPLIANNQKLGTLVMGFREAHIFMPDEVDLCDLISKQIALAILKARLDSATRERAVELGRMYAAAQDMASSIMDPPALLNKLAHHMVEALEATSGNIMSIDLSVSVMQVSAEYWSSAALPMENHSDLGKFYSISDFSTVLNAMIAGKIIILHDDSKNLTKEEQEQFAEYGIKSMLFVPILAHGKLLGNIEIWESRRKREFTLAEIRMAQAMAGHAASIIENVKLFEALEQREAYFRALIENSAVGVAILDEKAIVRYIAPSEEQLTGHSPDEIMGKSVFQYIDPQDRSRLLETFTESVKTPGVIRTVEYRLLRKDGEWRYFEATGHNMLNDPHLHGIVLNYRDITERKHAEQALRENESRLEAVITTALNGIITIDAEQRIILFNPSAERIFGCSASDAIGQRLEKFMPERFRHKHEDNIRHYADTGMSSRNKGLLDTLYGLRTNGDEFPMEGFISQSQIDGRSFFTVIFQDITERKHAEEELRRHAMELETLAAASSALRTAQNVTEMVPILARQALRAVKADYASIFLLEPETGEFVSRGWYAVDTPFDLPSPEESLLRQFPNQGITGRIALTGEIYLTEDIQKDPVILILEGERERLKHVHGGISLPLRNQEKIIGIMHIWSLTPRIFNETDIRLLIALAETTSSAIHRSTLFEQTLQHADELAMAYDNTLAGWARALELRDEITEGHTRRVTELTLSLARALGISESEIIHIRRGALLHDIGKMGIPDSILHKPGAFTVQERLIMEQHTQYAYDMLSSIPFLQPALDIPFCHHEHWDGNGYPRKLKGEQIPLSARIFTVVDVWDALTSDRPYRPAWSKEKTREYIIERAGKQFDPRIVEAFFLLEV